MSDRQSNGIDENQAACFADCRARRLGESNLVECLTEVPSCHWQIPFGEGRFCGHLSNQMISMGALPAGRLQGVPEIS